jgi:hypothetical protein
MAKPKNAFESFSRVYLSLYGAERWIKLCRALMEPTRYCALINKFADEEKVKQLLGIPQNCTQFVRNYPYAYLHIDKKYMSTDYDRREESISVIAPDPLLPNMDSAVNQLLEHEYQGKMVNKTKETLSYPWPSPSLPSSLDQDHLSCYYPMDGASILPVIALDLHPTSRVLDLCAAPGGKSLVILSYLDLLNGGSLTCCDISPSRQSRLFHTLQLYLPPSHLSSLHLLTGDATSSQFYHRHHQLFSSLEYDRILVDAPCSSERHVLNSSKELQKWSPSRSKTNSERQSQLLYQALTHCLIPGRVVYSTCSLSPLENDEVVKKVVQKVNKWFLKQASVLSNNSLSSREVISQSVPLVTICDPKSLALPFGEETGHGWLILPDKCQGMGPIYLSVMELTSRDIRAGECQTNDSLTKDARRRRERRAGKGEQ